MSRVAALQVLVALACGACDISTRQKKLPEIPTPPAISTEPADPTAWTAAGDRACPAVETNQSLPGGPPGSTLREGRITRDPDTGRLACQVVGTDHGPATEGDPRSGGTASGAYGFGKRTGPWTGRYADGRLAWRGTYSEGVQTGQWTYWSPGGAPLSTGTISGDRRTGMWVFWDDRALPSDPPARFEHYGKERTITGVVLDGEAVPTHAVCLLGMALPRCQIIIASGIMIRAGPDAGGSAVDDARWSLVFDGDIIANVARRHGVGVGVGIYVGDEYARTGLRANYRYWLDTWLAAEVSAGVLFRRGDLDTGEDRGDSARLALSFADQASIGVEIQRYDDDGDGRQLSGHLTLKIGIVPLAVTAAVALRVAAAFGGK